MADDGLASTRRVRAKLARLEEMLRAGTPVANSPRSVRQFASWEDGESGLERIPSPNDVALGHPINGPLIRLAVERMAALADLGRAPEPDAARPGGPRRRTLGEQRDAVAAERDALRDQLVEAVNGWHEQRHAVRALEAEKEFLERWNEELREKAARLDEQVRTLTRQVAALSSTARLKPVLGDAT